MAAQHQVRTAQSKRAAEKLPENLRPLPAQRQTRPFWLELGIAVVFSLGALVAVSGWIDHCTDAESGCWGARQSATQAELLAEPPPIEVTEAPDTPEPEDRAVLSHAFTPLPLSFEDRTTRHFVLPPGRSMLDLATETGRIALDDVALIAVVQQNGVRHALVRLPDGRILRLQQGDPLDGGTVAAISEDAIYLLDAQQQPRALVLGG